MAQLLDKTRRSPATIWLEVRPLAGTCGFTLVEVLVATFVLSVGVLATLGVFTVSKSLTLVAQRHEVAVHQLQKELENLHTLKYAELALTGGAVWAEDALGKRDLRHRISSDGQSLEVRPELGAKGWEPVVADSGKGKVPPTGSFTVSSGSSSTAGKIYRYVTWRDENCGGLRKKSRCPGTQNSKRLIIAVAVDAKRGLGPTKPVWASTIAIDPEAAGR